MKNKTGIASGFIFGLSGFLTLFRLLFLDHIPPEDELAPGIVVSISILNGILFAYAGYLIQNYFGKRKNHN